MHSDSSEHAKEFVTTEFGRNSDEFEHTGLERRQSFDHVRKLVQQEGKEARNLVSWQIPADQPLNIDTSHVFSGEARKIGNFPSTNGRTTKYSSPRSLARSADASNLRLKHRADGDFRALHWTHLLDTLRRTVDAIYDICQVDQSVLECKEAIMFLEDYTKDFVALIEFLNAEAAWERSDRPTAIAWEIRKTVGSPNKPYNNNNVYNENYLPEKKISTINFENSNKSEIVADEANCDSGLETPSDSFTPIDDVVSPKILSVEVTGLIDETENRHETSCDDQMSPSCENDEGWKVVTYSKHRRNSKDLSLSPTGSDRQCAVVPSKESHPPSTIVDDSRLRRLRIFPKSAQEIRQTKASLAKMEHNRQYLAEQRQKEMSENLKIVKFYATSSASSKFRRFNSSGGSLSLPSLNQIGINFADPAAVKRIAQAAKANMRTWKVVGGGRKNRFRSYQSAESLCSLESIKEDDNEVVVETIAAAKADHAADDVNIANCINDVVATPPNVETAFGVAPPSTDDVKNEGVCDDSKSTFIVEYHCENNSHLDTDYVADDDEAWQHLTEEEESLAQEEENLQKEIEEERKSIDIEVNRCTAVAAEHADDDDDEADNDSMSRKNNIGSIPNLSDSREPPVEATPMTWQELVERWKAECPTTPFSWAEIMEIELAEVRSPGQAVQMHEKLSSPSRKRNNPDDTIRKHEERQAKAEGLRQRLLDDQMKRLSKLLNRVDEVRSQKELLLERKRDFMESRLAKAAENRSSQLQMKVKKAHDEEEKVHEIAFINSLEADNKRHDVMIRHQDHEMRLQSIQEERQRKLEEKAAREQAVEERRKAAEEERQARLREIADRTKRRQEKIELHRTEQEQQRQQIAKEKAREREERLAGRRAARQATTEELLQRIQQKQEESLRRHEENLGLIKQRACEMSAPRSANQISNEVALLAHINGSRHVDAVKENLINKLSPKENSLDHEIISKCIVEASDDKVQSLSPILNENDKIKSSNKRRQKIRQKILAKTKEFQSSTNNNLIIPNAVANAKLVKCDKEIEKCYSSCGLEKQWLPPDVHSLERALNEINRTFGSSPNTKDQEAFYGMKSKSLLLKLLSLVEKSSSGVESLVLPSKCLVNVCSVLKLSVRANGRICLNSFYSGQLLPCIDALASQLKFLNSSIRKCSTSTNADDVVCIALFSLVNEFLTTLTTPSITNYDLIKTYSGSNDAYHVRSMLLVGYLVASRCVDNISTFIKDTADNELNATQTNFVIEAVVFIKLLMKLMHESCKKAKDNSTQFLETLKSNELCSVVSFLYSILLNPSNVLVEQQHNVTTNVQLTENHIKIVCAVLDLINYLSVVDLKCLQEILCQEGTSLEFRHIASFLLSYGNRFDCPEVLHRIIISIGFFTTSNSLNQDLVHSGSQPSILHQLCVLPFAYFSDPRLTKVLFPTLIACCYRNEVNRRLLEEELSGKLLSSFIEDNLENEEKKDEASQIEDDNNVFSFGFRFPSSEFERARDYFSTEMSLS